ncbi:MAG: cupin domain-containing protein [Candidatus Dormibacteria bacterium]
MPRTRKEEAPILVDEPVITGRYVELGPYTLAYESFPTDFDPAALFQGLPDDRCQCPHWGVVTSGELVIRYADHVESYAAGDAYYVEPGHLPHPQAGTDVVEFSPTDALQATMAVVGANMAPQENGR